MDARTMYMPITALPATPIRVVVDVTATVLDAIAEMRSSPERTTGCAVVVDQQKLVGIVTERDIVKRLLANKLDPTKTTVDEIMTPNPDALTADDPIAFALNIMHLDRCRHVPIVDENNIPIGMVSSKDIVFHFGRYLKMRAEEEDPLSP